MPEYTKEDLDREIELGWAQLTGALDQLTESKMTEPKDAEGWSVKDHLTHLAAWERSVVYLLQGKPRHEGLGVDESLYLNGGYDKINAAIQQHCKDLTVAEALADLRSVHGQLVNLVNGLSEDDLQRPYSHYLPDEPGEDDPAPILYKIYGNSAGHFKEHLDWIQSLVNRVPQRETVG